MSADTPTRRFSPAMIVTAAVAALVVILGISAFASVNSAQSTGTRKEAALTAQYSAAQNELSTLIGTVKDSLGVANIKAEKMDEIIAGAIAGRYDGQGTADVSEAQLAINAIHEAYPDLTPLDSYDGVIATITAGRQSFKDQQNRLLDLIRDFDAFTNAGLVHRQVVSIAGIPDDTLRATIGGDTVTGAAALERMRKIVTAEGTTEAYQSGTIPDLVPTDEG